MVTYCIILNRKIKKLDCKKVAVTKPIFETSKKELDVVQLDVTYLILIIVVFTTKSKLLI